MRFNSTYQPLMNFKKTIEAVDELQSLIFNQVNKWFDFIKMTPPLFYPEESELKLNLNNITRQITFDTLNEYRIISLTLSHSNWMRQMIDRLKLDYNQGIFIESNLIWRDIQQLPTNSIVKHELIFQIKIKNDEENKLTKQISNKLYSLFYQLAALIKEKYQVPNIWPVKPNFITSQMMEHELPNESPKNREREFALQNEAFILESPGIKLFSGKRHNEIPSFLYDLKNNYKFIFNDRNNHLPIEVANVSLLANGYTLKDQVILYGYEKILTNNFYQSLLQHDYKVLEIKINLPQLMMALLAKGHIGEVQAGVISNEIQQIKEKHGVEII